MLVELRVQFFFWVVFFLAEEQSELGSTLPHVLSIATDDGRYADKRELVHPVRAARSLSLRVDSPAPAQIFCAGRPVLGAWPLLTLVN